VSQYKFALLEFIGFRFFENYKELDYARSGFEATETVILEPGPCPKFDHSMEAYLRTKLGMPTSLKNGIS
jgi:mRNA turnover protein 4